MPTSLTSRHVVHVCRCVSEFCMYICFQVLFIWCLSTWTTTWWACWSRAWSSSPMSTFAASCASWWRVWTTAIRTTFFTETSNALTSYSTTGKEQKKWTPGVKYCVDSWFVFHLQCQLGLYQSQLFSCNICLKFIFKRQWHPQVVDLLTNINYNAALSTATAWNITAAG